MLNRIRLHLATYYAHKILRVISHYRSDLRRHTNAYIEPTTADFVTLNRSYSDKIKPRTGEAHLYDLESRLQITAYLGVGNDSQLYSQPQASRAYRAG